MTVIGVVKDYGKRNKNVLNMKKHIKTLEILDSNMEFEYSGRFQYVQNKSPNK